MSKMDGDARGGSALSLKQVTGKPIKFISAGEKPDSLEPFHPDRMAKRILGMGDVVSLIEHASKIQAEEIEAETAERVQKANINLNDFLEIKEGFQDGRHLEAHQRALPGGDKAMAQGQVDIGALDRMETIIFSMTKAEREKPELLNGSRRQRIAAGSGTSVQEVNQVMKQFNETRKMMKKMMPAAANAGRPRRRAKKRQEGQEVPFRHAWFAWHGWHEDVRYEAAAGNDAEYGSEKLRRSDERRNADGKRPRRGFRFSLRLAYRSTRRLDFTSSCTLPGPFSLSLGRACHSHVRERCFWAARRAFGPLFVVLFIALTYNSRQ